MKVTFLMTKREVIPWISVVGDVDVGIRLGGNSEMLVVSRWGRDLMVIGRLIGMGGDGFGGSA